MIVSTPFAASTSSAVRCAGAESACVSLPRHSGPSIPRPRRWSQIACVTARMCASLNEPAGHEMYVFDVVTAQTAPLAAAGAHVARTIAELAGQCEVVVTMLVEDAIVTQVALGPSGLSSALAAGTIHLVMGTHGVATVRELESKHRAAGQTLVAAPVLGRPDLAASGQL